MHASKRFSGRYETILWFTKSDHYTFNLDSVRIPSKYPSKRHFKGDKKGQLSGNPKGKNPSDFWDMIQNECDCGVMDVPNVKANHSEKTQHPCQFPVELIERFILALTNKDDFVLDPFDGVGTVAIASLKNERNSICIEKDIKYCQIAQSRIDALKAGTLKIRPLGKPIHVPKTTDKIAQIPMRVEQMIIAGIYSFNNGKEYIEKHFSDLLSEVKDVISKIDRERHKTKISKEKTMQEKFYIARHL